MESKGLKVRAAKALLLWGPVLGQMALIFYFSAQPSGSSVLEQFPVSAPVGHLGGYFLLGLFLYRAINRGSFAWKLRTAFFTMACGVIYAASDEFHQLFVPGREATLTDIGFDALGILIFLLLVRGREAILKG